MENQDSDIKTVRIATKEEKMENQDSDIKTVRIATKEQLLSAGYVPEGRNLRGKDGSLLDAGFLTSYSGKTATARVTESKEFPVTVDDYVLPAVAVAFEVAREKNIRGVDYVMYSDGSVSAGSTHFTVKETARLAALFDLNQKL